MGATVKEYTSLACVSEAITDPYMADQGTNYGTLVSVTEWADNDGFDLTIVNANGNVDRIGFSETEFNKVKELAAVLGY
jgi:hypothetical protein